MVGRQRKLLSNLEGTYVQAEITFRCSSRQTVSSVWTNCFILQAASSAKSSSDMSSFSDLQGAPQTASLEKQRFDFMGGVLDACTTFVQTRKCIGQVGIPKLSYFQWWEIRQPHLGVLVTVNGVWPQVQILVLTGLSLMPLAVATESYIPGKSSWTLALLKWTAGQQLHIAPDRT